MPFHEGSDLTKTVEPRKIVVVGLGYVGCVTAACFSSLGHKVVGVDRDQHKVSSVLDGQAPFFEPGLEDLIRKSASLGNLSAKTELADAVADADIILICVGTPSEKNGNLGLDQLRRVIGELAVLIRERSGRPPVIAIRSTVFPGTCEEVVISKLGPDVPVVCNPEFLREGTAVKDFIEPSLVVVGGTDAGAVDLVAGLYEPLGVPACKVSLRTAEMIKYASNAFHATKIAFANEIGSLSARLGVDGQEVMRTVCEDVKLNASAAYLRPGFAFGGSCLPKDLRALVYRAGRLDLRLPLLQSVLPSNEQHLTRSLETVLELPGRKLGVIGLAFKEDTDDLRESPVVSLLEQLIGKGRELRIYDPHIQLSSIYGSNRNYILSTIPHIERLMVPDVSHLLSWADHLVVAQKQKPAIAERLESSGLPILDLTVATKHPAVMALK